jgi:hypothetical protein
MTETGANVMNTFTAVIKPVVYKLSWPPIEIVVNT